MVARRKRNIDCEFRVNGIFGKLIPKDALRELRRLKRKYGRLTPEIVLDSARSTKSPLHDMFEWDDAVAAEKYRLSQARNLILNIRIKEATDDGVMYGRVFVRDVDDQGSHYVEVDHVVSEGAADRIMGNAIRDLRSWMHRYNDLSSRLPGVFDAIYDVLDDE